MPRKQNLKKSRFVPYAKGFKVPSEAKQKEAVGFSETSSIPSEFKLHGFKPVKKCRSIDDWLAQYNEKGQTYAQFLRECPWLSSRKGKFITQTFVKEGKNLPEKYPQGKIYILPLGNVDSFADMDALITYTRNFLQLPIEKLPGINLEVDNYRKKVYVTLPDIKGKNSGNEKSLRKKHLLQTRFKSVKGETHFQIMVHPCLQKLRLNVPDDALCVVALTTYDLYEDNTDLFVAGMASGNQRVAIFSLFRYDPSLTFSKEFWYKFEKVEVPDEKACRRQMLQRGCRLLVHEINHILGIDHCVYFDCCMNGSGHLQEDFSQPMYLCPVELRKLHRLVGFDILERYRQLENFCREHGFEEELAWYKMRIASISSDK